MTVKKYVFLQNDEVVVVLTYDDSDPYQAGMISALEEGAIWEQVDENNPADQFWTWDGTTATSPTDETWTVS